MRAKVIHMVENMGVGGLERVIATIVQGLNKEKFAVEVWCVARGGVVADELQTQGLKVRVLDILNYHKPAGLFKLIAMLKKAKADIVHTHGYFAGTVGRIAAKLAGTRVIINHVHSTYWGYKWYHLGMERLLSLISAKIICCSRAIAGFVTEAEKVRPDRVRVIYNGIASPGADENDIRTIRREFGISEDERVIITVASLTAHKGHKYLLGAAPKVLAAFPRARFLLAGDGPQRQLLEQQAKTLGLGSRIIFAGIRHDIPALLSLADIFVLPSCEREGLGIAIIEAMAQGKAAIGTNLGGIVEVIKDRVTGLLVPPADIDRLAEAIIALLSDPEKTRKMGEEGRGFYEETFRALTMIAQIEQLYEECLAHNEPAR